MLDAGAPQRRLPDTRLADEHERARADPHLVEERGDRAELLLSANDLEHVSRLIVTETVGAAKIESSTLDRNRMYPMGRAPTERSSEKQTVTGASDHTAGAAAVDKSKQ